MNLDLREATSLEDRLAVLALSHAAFRVAGPVGWYQASRLASARRREARWWLLEDQGTPVCSLLVYPLALRNEGVVVAGYGLGAVATHPDHQGRGHASRLCRHVGEVSPGAIGVLFSGVAPAFYERLGFRVVPSHAAECVDLAGLVASGPHARLVPMDPIVSLGRLREAFDRATDGLRSHRDNEGWRRSIASDPEELYFAVDGGYVRVCVDDGAIEVIELVADDPGAVFRALVAGAPTVEKVTTWLVPPSDVAGWFVETSRAQTLPMVRGGPTTAWLSSADYF